MRVWEAPGGRCLGVGVGHVGAVSAVAFGRKLKTVGAAGAGAGGDEGEQQAAQGLAAPSFLVSAGADKLLKVWDLEAAVSVAVSAAAPVSDEAPKKKRKGADAAAVAEAAPVAAGPVQMRVSAAVAAHDKDINSVSVAPNDGLVATGVCSTPCAACMRACVFT